MVLLVLHPLVLLVLVLHQHLDHLQLVLLVLLVLGHHFHLVVVLLVLVVLVHHFHLLVVLLVLVVVVHHYHLLVVVVVVVLVHQCHLVQGGSAASPGDWCSFLRGWVVFEKEISKHLLAS